MARALIKAPFRGDVNDGNNLGQCPVGRKDKDDDLKGIL